MAIEYNQQENTFHISNQHISYVIGIEKETYLVGKYFGKKLNYFNGSRYHYLYDRGFCSNPDNDDKSFSLDTILNEFPDSQSGDFRTPAYQLEGLDGDPVTRFSYQGYEIHKGKEKLAGLPYVRVFDDSQAESLIIHLKDSVRQLELDLTYTIYDDQPIITRSAKLLNLGQEPVYIKKLMSYNLDFLDGDWEVLTLYGSHINEKNLNRRPIQSDLIKIGSTRGTSSPQSSPFIGLVKADTTENSGEAYGFTLMYSGSFEGSIEKSQYGTLRTQLGIQSKNFKWLLEPEDVFQAPEVILTYSDKGLNKLSQGFHRLFVNQVMNPQFAKKERPILINSWEGHYFDIDEDNLYELAVESHKLGFELFVIDDGWFKKRNSDRSSLGDWVFDDKKFPSGFEKFAARIRALNLKLGIWFEPEMVSPDSELYRHHPNWVIKSWRYEPILSRNQLVLDLTNPNVREYLVDSISNVIEEGEVSYVKWDMNRHLTDLYSVNLGAAQQGELSHRYVLGLYDILERLTQRFPNVIFENCSSGGGRFDAGMLYYMPQTWTSDNTDAIARLQIQNGTSLLFPQVAMGNHVSDIPNHQLGRLTPLETRFNVACAGNLGYELDLVSLSDEEKAAIKSQITFYKKYRKTFQFGKFYRLSSANDNIISWQIVSQDGNQVILIVVQKMASNVYKVPIIHLHGLDEEVFYQNRETKEAFCGDELMYSGLTIPRMKGDYISKMYVFEKLKEE